MTNLASLPPATPRPGAPSRMAACRHRRGGRTLALADASGSEHVRHGARTLPAGTEPGRYTPYVGHP